jgi:hypothetical protein
MSERAPTFARALRDHRLNGEADIATVGALIGDEARAAMLLALFGGAMFCLATGRRSPRGRARG